MLLWKEGPWARFFGILLVGLSLVRFASSFDFSVMRTCNQDGVCRRNREYGRNIASSTDKSYEKYYSIDIGSLDWGFKGSNHTLSGNILKKIPNNEHESSGNVVVLPFNFDILEGGLIRFTISENRDPNILGADSLVNPKRFQVSDLILLHESDTFPSVKSKDDLNVTPPSRWNKERVEIEDPKSNIKVLLHLEKFLIEVYKGGQLEITINDRSFFNFEHYRPENDQGSNVFPEEISFDSFIDTFENANTPVALGPESIGVDITLHGYQTAYGLPQHPDTLKLRDTTNEDPYRLFNMDTFEYPVNSTIPTYGAIPLLISNSPNRSAGIFWVNSADTWVDIKYDNETTKTHWFSENGVFDVVLILGDKPSEITEKYTDLTGKPALPLLSAIGYHQCRWNYNSVQDVLTVNEEFDLAEIPLDFLWLDVDYTDNRKYFTWKRDAFTDPYGMLSKLEEVGRNMAVLIDPHLKTNYNVSNALVEAKGVVRNPNGTSFIGECWPGDSVWIDTLSQTARDLWAKLYTLFTPGVKNLFIWNDMNEPSVFDGIETTLPKNILHEDGYEHRSVHNIYGKALHDATYQGLIEKYKAYDKRPFVLTRSFFGGSQRTAVSWTGDSKASWDYLKIAIPLLLTNNIAGMPVTGADVGGFAGNPPTDLLVRWYQSGVWYPFFRAHAHINTKRREPYLLPEPAKSIIRDVIRLRYALLPTFYTAFHESSIKGTPIMAPMFYAHPSIKDVYDIQDQFYLGEQGILVKPVNEENATTTDVYLPPGVFYEYQTFDKIESDGKYITVDTPLEKIPMFLEGGHIIARKDRYRRSAKLMQNDPLTIVVAPDANGEASGTVYMDDGETFAYRNGQYLKGYFKFSNNQLMATIDNYGKYGGLEIEKVIIINPNVVSISSGEISVQQEGKTWKLNTIMGANSITIKNPKVSFGANWVISL